MNRVGLGTEVTALCVSSEGAADATTWARPARPFRRSGTSPMESPARFSTAAGVQTSRIIVAVNKDEEAPIFELVDFGVVGDLYAVLLALTSQINTRKS